jgi:sugar lactone lactonase YvrE
MSSQQRRAGAAIPLALIFALAAGACAGEDAADGVVQGISVADVGFASPESIVADTIADIYYVSNINGSPTGEDDNGFIARVTPDGQVENLKWIDGANTSFTLNAPKGMAIRGDTLYVADIKCIRMFNRVTGERANEVCIEAASFLNDVAVSPDGSLFVTDSGLRAGAGGLEPNGTDAVYRLVLDSNQRGATIAKDADLGNPNGIAVGSRGIFVVTFGSGEILRFTANGEKTVVIPGGERQLDGIIFDNAGGFAFSSWGESAVYHVDSTGQVHTLVEGIDAPADIGYDPKRNRVLIPLFNENRLVFHDL